VGAALACGDVFSLLKINRYLPHYKAAFALSFISPSRFALPCG